MGILVWIIVGFFAGLIARALMPGKQSMGLLATTALGCVGSIVGGLVGNAIWGRGETAGFTPGGLFLSVLGAFVLLLILAAVRRPSARARA